MRRQEITQCVAKAELPQSFHNYIDLYEAAGWTRPRVLWQWCWVLLNSRHPGFMLSFGDEAVTPLASTLKLNLIMVQTIGDDLADVVRDEALMRQLLDMKLERDRLPPHWRETHEAEPTIGLLGRILDDTVAALSQQRNWERMRDIFFYDLKQVWNAAHHAYLSGSYPEVINYEENRSYNAHSIMSFIMADIDLICSGGFDFNELPQLRSVVHYAQRMGRISNSVGTWQREIVAGDLTSGLLSLLLSRGVVKVDTLLKLIETDSTSQLLEVARESLVEEALFEEWESWRVKMLGFADQVKSVDVRAYVEGVELFMCYHLACRGLI